MPFEGPTSVVSIGRVHPRLQIRCQRGGLESAAIVEGVTSFVHGVTRNDAVPGVVIGIQTFGDFLGLNRHCYTLCTDGCFYGSGMFWVISALKMKHLEMSFRHNIFNRRRPLILGCTEWVGLHLGVDRDTRRARTVDRESLASSWTRMRIKTPTHLSVAPASMLGCPPAADPQLRYRSKRASQIPPPNL
jgi:hypothetical protein